MAEPVFYPIEQQPTLADIVALVGGALPEGADPERRLLGVAPLDRAGPDDLAYMDNARYGGELAATRAGACLVSQRFAAKVPPSTIAIVVREPYRGFAAVMGLIYSKGLRPGTFFGATGISHGAIVHPDARIEAGAVIDPGAVVGPRAEIGRGTVIAAGAVIGPDVRIGRDCSIGAGATIQCALIGNRVIIHPGVRLGQDGFGFAMSPRGHLKVPQVGRVIVQDDVEIGANTTVDRGATRDTIIGEGTKIDNLVQIAHNVVIGRHCVIVSQVGISGSTTLGDFVVLGGKTGVIGHVTVGRGAQIAAASDVNTDVPPGVRWGGTPARPVREWFREIMTLKKLAASRGSADAASED